MNRFANDAATATLAIAFVTPLILIAVYTIAAPWHKTTFGRAFVPVTGSISLALLPPFVHRVTHPGSVPGPSFTLFQAVTWGLLAIGLVRMTWLIWREQLRGAQERHKGG
jgi:hypothetical protein